MNDRFKQIYKYQTADYHRLILSEDAAGNLLSTLKTVTPLKGKRILDLGTGTGRLPLLLRHQANRLVGIDLYTGMLQEHKIRRDAVEGNWSLTQGDMRSIPIPSNYAEVVIAGWTIGHFTGWYTDTWQAQVSRVLQEMHRVVTPGGMLIIIETLTTGSSKPIPPTKNLGKYYLRLEREWGFTRREIQTDYQFANVEEAINRSDFFFGSMLSSEIRQRNWAKLPEWTGVWSKMP